MTEFIPVLPLGPRRRPGLLVAVYVLVSVVAFVAGFVGAVMVR